MRGVAPAFYKTIPGYHLSELSPTDLKHLSEAVNRFEVERLRFTANGQIAVAGLTDDELADLSSQLKAISHPLPTSGIAAVYQCGGCSGWGHGISDTRDVTEKIRKMDIPAPMPARVKIAIAGCPRCCTMPLLRDVGLFPGSGGWNLSFGGNAGNRPRIGDLIAHGVTTKEALQLVQAGLRVYQREAAPKMRTSVFIEQIGIEAFKEKINKYEIN